MRLASFEIDGRPAYGAIEMAAVELGGVGGARVADLSLALAPAFPTLRALIERDGLAAASAALTPDIPRHDIADITWRPPVIAPEKLWCIGVNYRDRNEEYGDGADTPKYPSLFCRAPTSFVGHGQNLERPRVSEQLDYEGEIALVIGRRGRHVAREDALGHVFGLTLCNEGTVRDWLRHGKFNVTQGKNFDRSGSLGPWIVTADELDPARPLQLTTRVNGEVRQSDSTSRLVFGFDALIAYLSTFATLLPGDVIMTGTPTGAGARFDPPRWLRPGDVVEIEVPGIGVLRNGVIDEAC